VTGERPEDDPGWYDEMDDREACFLLYAYQDEEKAGNLTPAVLEHLNASLEKLIGPIRRHETARLLYFLTKLSEAAIGRLINVPPFWLSEAFDPWDMQAGCGHNVKVATRRQVRRPPAQCRLCKEGADPQRLFTVPAPPMSWAVYEARFRRPDWPMLRRRKLREQPVCALGGQAHGTDLDVHHNDYTRFGRERLSDLIVLCRECHEQYHQDQRRRRGWGAG